MNFSVLMSIYFKEKPSNFNRAMQSIWDEQSIKPSEIVLVEDGKLTDELYSAINLWKERLGHNLKVIKLKENLGLGDALAMGLKECNFALVARMDSDDISLPKRFEKQLEIFRISENIDICSSWISEFETDESNVYAYRKLPESHNDIVKFAKLRSPLNHVAVMFKKSAVLQAGNYEKMLLIEDYYLWVRMILKGFKFYNIQEVLVNVRAGKDQLTRRQGLKYAINELKVQYLFYKMGFLNLYEFLRNSVLKFSVRIMPKFILRVVYKILRR
ncbi:glycosyltransferase [Campylobacter ureolyticus]|uniref:glycosyltransferase n=1 Tax=Campylobacter ureolyticus TaxID=827 RepID=UPI0022B46371|nr:glycosyltransferase [Campylobacter ureolyticus]MCZ6132572.1 glycosyltransferase [Campylobacter ureolyticus]